MRDYNGVNDLNIVPLSSTLCFTESNRLTNITFLDGFIISLCIYLTEILNYFSETLPLYLSLGLKQ